MKIYNLDSKFVNDFSCRDKNFYQKQRPYIILIVDEMEYCVPISSTNNKKGNGYFYLENSEHNILMYKCFKLRNRKIIDGHFIPIKLKRKNFKKLYIDLINLEGYINNEFKKYIDKHHPTDFSVSEEISSELQSKY